jgi:hypothetical protein
MTEITFFDKLQNIISDTIQAEIDANIEHEKLQQSKYTLDLRQSKYTLDLESLKCQMTKLITHYHERAKQYK